MTPDAPTSSPVPESTSDVTQRASINDVWAQYYAQYDPSTPATIRVFHTIHFNRPKNAHRSGDSLGNTGGSAPLPILIDSAASCSVVGEKWIDARGKDLNLPPRIRIDREFRFGDGSPFRSLGDMALPIIIPKARASDRNDHLMVFQVDIVKAVVPLSISQQALTHMQGKMDFSTFTLELPAQYSIQLAKSSTGHVLLPGIVGHESLSLAMKERHQLFPMRQTVIELRRRTDSEVLKIHQQLGHCSEKQLVGLLRFGRCKVDMSQIRRATQRCGCERSARRITPPVASSWVARFSGEVLAIDVSYPFTEIGHTGLYPASKASEEIPALLAADSLTRFISCQIAKGLTSETVSQVFVNDWVKRFGKQKRIILDQGGPGLDGREWEQLSRIFGWQYIRAPVRTPNRNGLAERTVRSLKAAVQSIDMNEKHTVPSQSLLTLAVIGKNHAPHATTGIPPSFAMTGRCDVASGASTCMWEHDPLSRDSLIPQVNALRKILEARNATIQDDSSRAIKACLNRNLIDRGHDHFPIGASVQIAVDGQWAGALRVVARSAGNSPIERGNKIPKWPK